MREFLSKTAFAVPTHWSSCPELELSLLISRWAFHRLVTLRAVWNDVILSLDSQFQQLTPLIPENAMRFDPARWAISTAGFVSDWALTRDWKAIALGLLPLLLLSTIGGLVWAGRTMSRRDLAAWYIELGEEEIKDWESTWSGTDSQASDEEEMEEKLTLGAGGEAEEDDVASDGSNEISQYADMLFRRVQVLDPSKRSQFIVAVSMAQRGAVSEAKDMLRKIAPDDGSGHPPSHAFLSLVLLNQFAKNRTRETYEQLRHHLTEALRSAKPPIMILKAGADLYWELGRKEPNEDLRRDYFSKSMECLERAAEVEPELQLVVLKRSQALNNQMLRESSAAKAKSFFENKLLENPRDDQVRLQLAEVYLAEGRIDEAEQLLIDRHRAVPSSITARGLSEIYRYRFLQSIDKSDRVGPNSTKLLDVALRYDPSNPAVVQEIARLAKGGGGASPEMIKKLREFLAEGKATALTHAWLSDAYLLRQDYEKAMPHLRQVVTRLPNASNYLNNMAYVLAETEPDKLEEALGYAQRAIQTSVGTANPDFYDTLAMILSRLGRSTEAIAAIETAIQLNGTRIDYHQRAADEYRKMEDVEMAENHERVIKMLNERKKEQESAGANEP